MMLANPSKALATAGLEKSRPLAAPRNDDLDPTLVSGTPESATHSPPQVLSLPPAPLCVRKL